MNYYQGYAKGAFPEEIRAFKRAHGRDPESVAEVVIWLFTQKHQHPPAEVQVTGGSINCGPIDRG